MLRAILLIIFGLASANIIFDRVQPNCNSTANGCLRGQKCDTDGACVPEDASAVDTLAAFRHVVSRMSRQLPRDDGRCGADFDDAVCNPDGTIGRCCSEYGYCGDTDDHCDSDLGCQSGCSMKLMAAPSEGLTPTVTLAVDPIDAPTTTEPSEDPTSTDAGEEPTLGLPMTASNPSANGPLTKDGSCGAKFGGSVCGNWSRGSCCSMYGYCGNSSAHCGAGCQSGPCLSKATAEESLVIPAPDNPIPGSFKVVGDSGVPVMHTALLPNGKVLFLDKVENYTKLILGNGQHAYAAEWDPATKKVTALTMKTNPFCSGGAFLQDGSLLSIGGNGPLTFIDPTVSDGFKGIRALKRLINDDDLDGDAFIEIGNLSSSRWYASAQTLSDGKVFVASGSLNGMDPTRAKNNNPTYEFLSKTGMPLTDSDPLDILVRSQPYYMYPFIHLLKTGDLFIFTSKSSEIWSPVTKDTEVVFPDLPGDYRTYPNTGTSVLLPLSSANQWSPDILICGGGAYQDLSSPTDPSCGRIAPLDDKPKWEMDAMPEPRGMVEGVLLADGSVVFLNGCSRGAQGFGLGARPAQEALLYNPNAVLGKRWTKLASSPIPRMYHSVALLLLDGTVMIAGSNPFEQPVLQSSKAVPYVTDFRVEIYTPPYLSGSNAKKRPTNITIDADSLAADGSTFELSIQVPSSAKEIEVVLHHGGFVTHSLHMGQRMLFLDVDGAKSGQASQTLEVTMPPNNNIAPPGPYVLYVLADGIPSVGQVVMVS